MVGEAGVLQGVQAVTQEVGCDAVEGVAKVGVAAIAFRELAADQEGPTVADDVKAGSDGAVLPVGALSSGHGPGSSSGAGFH